MGKKEYDWLTKRVAAVNKIAPDTVTPHHLAQFVLSNGVDHKGQAQTAYGASGFGLGVDASFDPGKCIGLTAALTIDLTATRLTQSIIAVTRGPSRLDGTSFKTPIALVCMVGTKWTGQVDAEFSLGADAEFSGGWSADLKKPGEGQTGGEADEEKSVEIVGVSASFHIGLEASASAQAAHYFGWDPFPTFYSHEDQSELRNDLSNLLSKETRKKSLKREVITQFNALREEAKKLPDLDRQQMKSDMGLRRTTTWFGFFRSGGDFKVNDPSKDLIQNLQKLASYADEQLYEANPHREDWRAFRAIVLDLSARLEAFKMKTPPALCWLKITSVGGSLRGKIGGQMNAAVNVKGFGNASLDIDATLASADACKRRTRVVWQVQHGVARGGGAVLCTQDTVINYTSFDAKALSVVVNAETDILKKRNEESNEQVNRRWDGEGTAFKSNQRRLNVMTYQSSILYWRCPKGSGYNQSIEPLLGSGVAFGQSVVIKHLLDDLKLLNRQGKASPWLGRMADSLKVDVSRLGEFLKSSGVGAILNDLSECSQNLADKKSEDWGDRGVLLESTFTLKTKVSLAYKDGKLEQNFRKKLLDPQRTLQALRLRFRISDIDASEKAFRLGFTLLGTGMGVTFKKVEEAGTEGIVTLCCQYFDPLLNKDPSGSEEQIVPPVTLFSQ
jgi:hypothetical protein